MVSKQIVVIFSLLFLLIIPVAYAFNLLDLLNQGMESVTGRSAVTVSITAGANAPTISYVSLDKQTYAPTDGGRTKIEISFLATDAEGAGTLDNSTANVNISLSSQTSSNSTCTSATSGTNINYSCEVYAEYWWADSASWDYSVEVKDQGGLAGQNNTGNYWTYSAATYFNSSSSSLAWASVSPSATNQTSTTTMTLENTGNRATLDITTNIIDLSADGTATYIPAGNFSVFNSTTGDSECEYTNQSAAVTYGANPIVGVNNTGQDTLLLALARAQGVQESLYFCLFHVPSDLGSYTYNTTFGGSWDITGEAS